MTTLAVLDWVGTYPITCEFRVNSCIGKDSLGFQGLRVADLENVEISSHYNLQLLA